MIPHRFAQVVICLFICLSAGYAGWAQGFNPGPGLEEKHDYPIRNFFNKFSINLSTGYGRTFYRHTLENFSYLRNENGSYTIPVGGTPPFSVMPNSTVQGYSNWFTGADSTLIRTGDSPDSEVNGYKYLAATDTSDILMKGGGYTIPLHLSVYYNLYRLRLGGGVGLDFHSARVPEPDNFLSEFPEPGRISTTMFRYYFLVGYSVYEFYDNAFGVDVRVGNLNRGGGFQAAPGSFVNIGITAEKVISEYFRLYVRPAYEIKQYSVDLPDGTAINHRDNALFVNIGVSIRYPDLPRSPFKNDKIQMRHYISDPMGNRREFRGQPMWRKQDPKIGELFPEMTKTKRKRQAKRKNLLKKKN